MSLSRRKFLVNGSLSLAGTLFFRNNIFAKKDPMGTLKQLAAMGYKNVEHANYVDRKFYGYSPSEFKKVLNDLGLQMPSGHTVMSDKHWDKTTKDFTDAWKQTVEDAATVGQRYVISPWLDEN